MARTQVLSIFLCLALVINAAYFVEYHDHGHNTTGVRPHDAADEKIEVFVVTHSHDDMGWIYPVQQYYRQLVRYIIDSMVTSLHDHTERKFTQVEIGFFQLYWNESNEERRNQIRTIIKRGQLEFNLGGFTMNDESTPTYYEEVNQMTEGALWLKETLGVTAKSAWHIDPFGHSAATASLWSQIGFSGFGLNRIPYWLKDQMKRDKTLEFVWRGSSSLGKTSEIFAHVLDSHYGTPGEMDFNDNNGWGGIYIEDDKSLPDYNANQVADNFAKMIKERSSWYRHKKLLIPFGNDFSHWQATNSFVNMDKLIKYVNDNSEHYGMVVRYAHLSDYVSAVHALNLEWPVFKGDFFPYNDGPNAFWSGYYTSRPWKKQYLRQSDAKLAAAESIFAFRNGSQSSLQKIETLRSATSVCTHHDAVSGTETDATSADYDRRLLEGNTQVDAALLDMLSVSANTKRSGEDNIDYYAVYNQLGWRRKQYVSILSNSSVASVTWGYNDVDFQVNRVPSYSKDNAKYRIYFLVDLPPLSTQVYKIRTASTEKRDKRAGTINNPYLSLQWNNETGKLESITRKSDGKKVQASISLKEYRSLNGTGGLQASGAYIFRPDSQSIVGIGASDKNTATVNFQFAKARNDKYILLTSMDTFTSYQDSLIAAPTYSDNNGFKVSVRRLASTEGWGQNPTVSFFTWSEFPMKSMFPELSYAMGSQKISNGEATIRFSDATETRGKFTAGPIVVVTPRANDILAASVVSVDQNGFTVRVTDSDGKQYNGEATVDYFATPSGISQGEENRFSIQSGSASAQLSGKGSTEILTIVHEETGQDSIVLLSAKGKETYGLTVISKLANSFTVIIHQLTGDSSAMELEYIRLPRTSPLLDNVSDKVETKVVEGPFVKEVQQFYKNNYGQTIIQYTLNGIVGKVVEIVSEIGPLDVGGRELVTRLETSLKTRSTFYTDDNGLEIMERHFNKTTPELVAGNYYPMTERVFIRDVDDKLQLNLLSDSTHGASSLRNGEVEVMLHRRCTSDDGRGVGQALNDQTSIKSTLWLTLSDVDEATESHRILSVIQQYPPTIVKLSGPQKEWSMGATELPKNIHLMNVRSVKKGQLLIRIQHLFAKDEHPTLSAPVKINLKTLFVGNVKSIQEMNLSGVTESDKIEKLVWNTPSSNDGQKPIPISNGILVIQPMEIRTFLFTTQ